MIPEASRLTRRLAHFGFHLLWTMVLTYPLMTAVQLIGAHVGRVTGCGPAENMGQVLPRSLVTGLVGLLLIANTINSGVDIRAMGDAAELVAGRGGDIFTIGFALVSLLVQMFIPYRRYSDLLKWATLSLLAYAALLFMVKLDWTAAAKGLVIRPSTAGRPS